MFSKTAFEKIFRYREFKRADGRGQLNTGETISTASVKCYDVTAPTTDLSATMISDVAPYGSPATKVLYKVKAGTAGKNYKLVFQVTTSVGQDLESKIEMRVE